MKTSLYIIVMLFLASITYCQEKSADSTLVYIETTDGNEFFGQIIEEDSLLLKFSSDKLGLITIQKKEIKSRRSVNIQRIKDGKYWFENRQSSRYFWAPNGYGLKKGEGYYQNIYIFWNQFSIGITDQFSLGVTIIPFFLFNGAPTPVMLAPKLSFPIVEEKFNIGAGALIGTILGEDADSYGLVYGTSTFGSRDNNLSIALSYGYTGSHWAKSPVVNISALARTSNRGYFITENYLFPGGSGCLSLGGRWIWKKASLDYMFAMPINTGSDSFVAFPIIGFVIPFGG
ncbi:hypothetical protein [Saccharicrinis sp. GN24d3]|uniref:hypothetical protein n=1 Tax=Saccharicrinis sp. GN24d3 TaxID=3458416 RepID=UPI004035CD55